VTAVDHWVLDRLVDSRTAAATHVARAVMRAGNSWSVLALVGLGLALVLVLAGQRVAALAMGGAAVSALASTHVLKDLIDRPRPPAGLALATARSSSMPSAVGALTAGVAVALVMTIVWRSRIERVVVSAALATGVLIAAWGVLYLGAHWLTDVLAGWALGAACAVVSRWIAIELLARAPGRLRVARR